MIKPTTWSPSSPDGALTMMVYDLRGGLLEQTGVDIGTTRTVIDAARNMVERRLPTGQTVTIRTDSLNRVTEVLESGSATPVVIYKYLRLGHNSNLFSMHVHIA